MNVDDLEIDISAIKSRVRAHLDQQGFTRFMGTKAIDIGAGWIELEISRRKDLQQHHGYFHGGVVGALADNACGLAVGTLLALHKYPITSEYKINILRPAQGTRLRARGEVVKLGKTQSVCKADVFVIANEKTKLCATMLATTVTVAG